MVEWGFMDAQAFCENGMSFFLFFCKYYTVSLLFMSRNFPQLICKHLLFFSLSNSHSICFRTSVTGRRNTTSQEKAKRELLIQELAANNSSLT